MKDLLNDQVKNLIRVRVYDLGFTQHEFADYLNLNNDLTETRFTQSTVSKYENGKYKIPAEVLVICDRINSKKNILPKYPIERIIQKLEKLNPDRDFDLLRSLDVILERRVA